jgi:predicted N-acyltransferase
MIRAIQGWLQEHGASSMHWLFTTAQEGETLRSLGMQERLGVQFHWQNRGYEDFEGFLDSLKAKRRKNIRRERRIVAEQGFRFRRIHGTQATASDWRLFADYYTKTFQERFSLPTFNAGFFQEIARSLGDQVILIIAELQQKPVAGALLYRSDRVLYGRHWGGASEFDSLHFETCYYQGIDYAIEQGIERFEPGAQGEHKIWRGFLPTLTRSYHWIKDQRFGAAIDDFLKRETPAMLDYHADLTQSSPYKNT